MLESIFTLGREPAMSVAEIEAVASGWNATVAMVSRDFVLLRHAEPLPDRVIDRLGGSVKQGTVIDRWLIEKGAGDAIARHLTWNWMSEYFPDGRVEFGISIYGLDSRTRKELDRHFLSVKKDVKSAGRPVRYVTSREPQLSAVAIQRNGLIKNGHEFLLFVTAKEIIVATTMAVQDYQSYGLRDFGRPAADPKSGMLPPKVAQMMLNYAGVRPDDVLFDPFCGSGTILQEALLLGVKHVYGSDNSPKAVKDSQANIRWLFKEFPGLHATAEITLGDARTAPVKPTVIVTEPYLGKPLRGHEPEGFLKTQIGELQHLYIDTFRHWVRMMKPGGRIVMIWPELMSHGRSMSLQIDDVIAGMGWSRQPLLSANAAKLLGVADRHVLTYSRPEAKVRRQVRMWILTR